MDRWTLFAYKRTTYRGCHCHPEPEDSEFHILTNVTKEEIIEAMARYKAENDSYEFTAIKNGIVTVCEGGYAAAGSVEADAEYDALMDAAVIEEADICGRYEKRAEELTAFAKAREEAEKKQREEAEVKRRRDQELAELARLQAKYKPT